MMYLFHVEEEKLLSPCTFASAKNISKRKKNLGRDGTEVSAASDRGSYVYFEKEKLIALNRKEQSRWENKTVSAGRSKIDS